MDLDLARAELWNGGFYELALEMGPRDDDRLDRAISAAWTHPDVLGPVVRSRDPTTVVPPDLASQGAAGHLAGSVLLPGIGRAA